MAETKAALVEGDSVRELERVPLLVKGSTAQQGGYDERWLQVLLHRAPNLLPVGEIEPGFGKLLPISMEAKCGSGYIDNLFVTADGRIALVETKLWRNPEARRKVVAQVLDYAAAVSRMTYAEFERMALDGEFPGAASKPDSLYAIISQKPEVPTEADFIDAVSLSLKRGRILVIAAGDGIRSESELLVDLLQSHAGARFTFALIAIELFAIEGDRILAVPRTIAKTVMIERGVVRVDDDRVVVELVQVVPGSSGGGRITMTEELFFESMALIDGALPTHLREFLGRIAASDVEPTWLASLNLKWFGWPAGAVNLGYILKDGRVWTDVVSWVVGQQRARPYLQELAGIIGGEIRESKSGPYVVAADGKGPTIGAFLPQHSDAWAAAIQHFIERLRTDPEIAT